MQFLQAFPIAIIDEDYEGKHAAGLGMRQLAAAIEKEGFRVVAGVQLKKDSWWFEVWQPEAMANEPGDDRSQWALKPGALEM